MDFKQEVENYRNQHSLATDRTIQHLLDKGLLREDEHAIVLLSIRTLAKLADDMYLEGKVGSYVHIVGQIRLWWSALKLDREVESESIYDVFKSDTTSHQ